MTIDDENSVYVGGLPYNATEDSLRRVFDVYGAVVAVKVVNDRGPRAKCFAFVTFTNPRSAIDAIKDMDGRTIDGRVVRVNEVTNRGGRSNLSRDHLPRDGRDKGRDREMANRKKRKGYPDRYLDRSREHTSSGHRDKERREYERDHDHDPSRDKFISRDGDRYLEGNKEQGHHIILNQEHGRNIVPEGNQNEAFGASNVYHKSINEGKDYLSNFSQDRALHNGRDKGRERERDNDKRSERYPDRDHDRSREGRRPSQHCEKERQREYEHKHDHHALRDKFMSRDEDIYVEDNNEQGDVTLDQKHGSNTDLEGNLDEVIGVSNGYHKSINEGEEDLSKKHNGGESYSPRKHYEGKDYSSRKHNDSSFSDRHVREPSSYSSANYGNQVKELEVLIQQREDLSKEVEELETLFQQREELSKEVSTMKERLDEKEQVVSDLQRRSKKLEDELINAKKLSSQRRMQLTKLYKCFVQVKEYRERLKSSEQELQSIVDAALMEIDVGDDVGLKNSLL